ncbi:MAG: helix-turn-helix transcriptional regulator, partial [Vagococcus sp.]
METAISQNLKKYRKINHLTQQEMASQLFVTPQAVSKWERGESMPDISLVPQIANLFDISIASLWETLPEKSETEDFDELLTQLTDMASIRELISHFDFFTFLT